MSKLQGYGRNSTAFNENNNDNNNNRSQLNIIVTNTEDLYM